MILQYFRPFFLLQILAALQVVATERKQQQEDSATTTSYGLDVSFPIHRRASTNYPWLPHNVDPANNPTPPQYEGMPIQPLGDRQKLYTEWLNKCRDFYKDYPGACDDFENTRILMNQRQPQSMKNYTDVGFQKIRAPENVIKLIEEFWSQNHFKGKEEKWAPGNSFFNTWEAPTYLVSVDDKSLRGAGARLKEEIWAAASATLEAWTSEELQPCSLYGIRVYGEGAAMLHHVDRLPLVVSAMVSVAQDVDEDWPTEIYDHSGKAHNVTLHPGDMLLFESHSVIHGHPFPLKGRYYAMMFIHFEPTGHSLQHNTSGYYVRQESSAGESRSRKSISKEYRKNVEEGVGGQSAHASQAKLPPYIKRESPEESFWREQHPDGWKPPFETLPKEAHVAAMAGLIDKLEEQLKLNREQVLTERDEHGWQVLHQGVAGGSKDVVELLVEHGAEINARTHGGYGETPLRIAEKRLGPLHPVVEYLKGLGALSIGPEF